MKLANITEVDDFLKTVDECSGSVWLESVEGDKINLKSKLSQFSCEADKLKLFCSKYEDEMKFFKFFYENPEVL